MSQSAKRTFTQASARRNWAGALQTDALGLTEGAIRRAGFPDPSLVFRWADVVGADAASVARPVRCRETAEGLVLTIRCDRAASVFIQHETRTLLERVNAYLGPRAVARIQVVTGDLAQIPDLPPRVRIPMPPPDSGTATPLENALSRLEFLRSRLSRKRATPSPD